MFRQDRWRLFSSTLVFAGLLFFLPMSPVWSATTPIPPATEHTSSTARLSLTEALALFLRQNLDILIAKYGIEYNKGQQITARLFPNPVMSVGTVSSFTQGLTPATSGQLFIQAQQLFELAGKRGYRIESAGFGTQSAEAAFEDAVRQLGFTVKDSYYRVQLAQRRLALAEENRDRFSRILDINTIRFKKGYIAEVDLIRIRLQMVDFQSQVIQSLQEAETARGDLRQLLRLSPAITLELTTDLEFRRIDPEIGKLRLVAVDTRPDVRSKRFTYSQREADLRLAKAYRVPDVTVGTGYAIQGPQGPDLPQQWGLNLGLPLPLFNRGQTEAERFRAEAQRAAARRSGLAQRIHSTVYGAHAVLELRRGLLAAYRRSMQGEGLQLERIAEVAYREGAVGILELLDAYRVTLGSTLRVLELEAAAKLAEIELERAAGEPLLNKGVLP